MENEKKAEKRKLKYEKPVLMHLSYRSAEALSGQCGNGSVAAAAQCIKGGLAKNQCWIGLTAGQACGPGTAPSRCVSGSGG